MVTPDANADPPDGAEPSTTQVIVRVAVQISLPHLDRLFDYLVPPKYVADAVVGARVRVRFAGKLVDGFIVERAGSSDYTGKLAAIERVVSPEPVLSETIARVARQLADRSAGTMADILRLAIPPRRAEVEKSLPSPEEASAAEESGADDESAPPASPVDLAGWERYAAGASYVRALRAGRTPRAVWSAVPGEHWPERIAEAAAATVAAGRGVLVVLPDNRDVERVDAALTRLWGKKSSGGKARHVTLTAALGPQRRYRRFLEARRGLVTCVVGTRAAGFAPVANLGLVVLWDDGDDLHVEPHAPYCHSREVLLTRAVAEEAAVLIGGFTRTAESQLLVSSGWAHPLVAERDIVRAAAPRVTSLGEDAQIATDAAAASARLPTVAWRAARDALAADRPVLVQVPRRGYVPSLACQRCRAAARCGHCHGPLGLSGRSSIPDCRWCGRPAADWRCSNCQSGRLRASVVGARRTAEELGQAFPGVAVRTSGRDAVLSEVPDEPALVIATPGAEPAVTGGGYGAVLLLDAWALLNRSDLRATEETLRRWLNAAALARRSVDGGRVIVMADGSLPVVQALTRWDPGWFAEREFAEREEVGFPPAIRMAKLTGGPDALADFLTQLELPTSGDLLGPTPVAPVGRERVRETDEQVLVRVDRRDSAALAAALRAVKARRSAAKAAETVRVETDPYNIG